MAPIALESENHIRDAEFHKAMHGKSAETKGFRSMLNKDHEAHKLASEEYFKHWDNKYAGTETAETREARYSHLHFLFLLPQYKPTNTSIRLEKQSTQPSQDITTTSQPTSMNMAGEAHSTSAGSPMAKASIRPLHDMNTI